jgi:hypothetical protein
MRGALRASVPFVAVYLAIVPARPAAQPGDIETLVARQHYQLQRGRVTAAATYDKFRHFAVSTDATIGGATAKP